MTMKICDVVEDLRGDGDDVDIVEDLQGDEDDIDVVVDARR